MVNLFNHVNLGNPDSEIGVPGNLNPNAGRITSTAYGQRRSAAELAVRGEVHVLTSIEVPRFSVLRFGFKTPRTENLRTGEPENPRTSYRPPLAIEPRNSALLLVLPIFESSSSIASTGESGVRTLRSTQTRLRSSLGMSISSFRVPLF